MMSRSAIFGMAFGVATVLASAASAAPAAMFLPTGDMTVATQIQYYDYGCPPGYKVTSHGGCKLSHYLRRHPNQIPDNYGYRRQYEDRDYYDQQPRYYRRYDRPYQGGDDYYGDD